MADLLNDPGMRTMFERTFAVVSRKATLDEARDAMKDDVRDVFVTSTGSRDDPVEGWLTIVDVGKQA